jgi:hypothetical protein
MPASQPASQHAHSVVMAVKLHECNRHQRCRRQQAPWHPRWTVAAITIAAALFPLHTDTNAVDARVSHIDANMPNGTSQSEGSAVGVCTAAMGTSGASATVTEATATPSANTVDVVADRALAFDANPPRLREVFWVSALAADALATFTRVLQSLLVMRKLLTAEACFACWPCFGQCWATSLVGCCYCCWSLTPSLYNSSINNTKKKHDHCTSAHVFVGCCLSRFGAALSSVHIMSVHNPRL